MTLVHVEVVRNIRNAVENNPIEGWQNANLYINLF